jgi:hypothetical protein
MEVRRRADSYKAYCADQENALGDLAAMLDAYDRKKFIELVQQAMMTYTGNKFSVMQVFKG